MFKLLSGTGCFWKTKVILLPSRHIQHRRPHADGSCPPGEWFLKAGEFLRETWAACKKLARSNNEPDG